MRKHTLRDGYNPRLKALILQVVDNQIAGYDENGQPITTAIADDPDYVKDNFARLSTIHGPPEGKYAKQPGAGRTEEAWAQRPMSVRKRKEV